PVAGHRDAHQPAQLGGRFAAGRLHMIDDLLRVGALPLGEQRRAVVAQVAKVPVESALGHAQPLRDRHDAQAVRSALGELREAGVQPVLVIQSIVHAATIPNGIDKRKRVPEHLHTKRYGESLMLIDIAAWIFVVLGVAHTFYGLARFKQPIREALHDGFVGQFKSADARRLAFWFTIAGPMMVMGGQVALHAVHAGDLALLNVVGFYMLGICLLGALALPKSPFWIALPLCPVLIAGGCGWLAL